MVQAPLRDRWIARVVAPLLHTQTERETEQLPGTPDKPTRARLGKAGPRMEGSSQMRQTPTYYAAGIDVAKDRLDVVLRPSGQYMEATNHERGIRSVVRRLRKENVALAVLQASGGSSSPPPRPSLSPGCRWRSSTPGSSGISPRPRASSPRPTGSTPRCSPTSPRRCSRS